MEKSEKAHDEDHSLPFSFKPFVTNEYGERYSGLQLPRFDICSGNLRIDGQDVQDIAAEAVKQFNNRPFKDKLELVKIKGATRMRVNGWRYGLILDAKVVATTDGDGEEGERIRTYETEVYHNVYGNTVEVLSFKRIAPAAKGCILEDFPFPGELNPRKVSTITTISATLDPNGQDVQDIAAEALEEYNKHPFKDKLELVKIKSVTKSLINCGWLYELTFDAKVATLANGEEGERTTQTYKTKVWRELRVQVEVQSFNLVLDAQGKEKKECFWGKN